jgi:thioredoxin-related protein
VAKATTNELKAYNFSTDGSEDICKLFEIQAFPTFIYFDNQGKPGQPAPGARNPVQIFRLLEQEMHKSHSNEKVDKFFHSPSIQNCLKTLQSK